MSSEMWVCFVNETTKAAKAELWPSWNFSFGLPCPQPTTALSSAKQRTGEEDPRMSQAMAGHRPRAIWGVLGLSALVASSLAVLGLGDILRKTSTFLNSSEAWAQDDI